MEKVTIYHNPRCSKSRQALELLQQHHKAPTIIEYLKTPPSSKELARIIKLLGIKPRELLRTNEEVYRSLKLKDTKLSDAELVAIMSEHPILIERPIVIINDQAVIGRPPEKILELL